MNYTAPDLTQHPPRSPRVRLGGFVHLPRMLDKCRALVAGKLGEYIFPCPLDKRFATFAGVSLDALLAEVKAGKSDSEMLQWVRANMKTPRDPYDVEAWSRWLESLSPGDAERHAGFAETLSAIAPKRDDIRTNFDRLDLDDYVSFGGKS